PTTSAARARGLSALRRRHGRRAACRQRAHVPARVGADVARLLHARRARPRGPGGDPRRLGLRGDDARRRRLPDRWHAAPRCVGGQLRVRRLAGGSVSLLAGAVAAMVGVRSAIVDRDLKRVLAFSSIENVGIILIGLGAGVLYHAAGLPALAVIGLTAALYHAVNHTAFKTLLFLGAGAVVHATGTRDMEALGGLIKRMPWTTACFLSGAVAAAALPPLN